MLVGWVTANLTVEMAAGSQLSATVSEGICQQAGSVRPPRPPWQRIRSGRSSVCPVVEDTAIIMATRTRPGMNCHPMTVRCGEGFPSVGGLAEAARASALPFTPLRRSLAKARRRVTGWLPTIMHLDHRAATGTVWSLLLYQTPTTERPSIPASKNGVATCHRPIMVRQPPGSTRRHVHI